MSDIPRVSDTVEIVLARMEALREEFKAMEVRYVAEQVRLAELAMVRCVAELRESFERRVRQAYADGYAACARDAAGIVTSFAAENAK